MEKSSREWFDYVYEISAGWLPFCMFNNKCRREDLIHLTRNYNLNPDEIDRLEEISSACSKSLPSEQDFIEEKRRIYPQLTEDLRSVLPDLETLISFGSIQGDIDLGIISSIPITDGQIDTFVKKEIIERYPLVDWDSLWFFKSTDGYELTQRIIKSRELCLNLNNSPLPLNEKEYIQTTVALAEILHGSEERLLEMKKEFFKFLILPSFLEN